MTEVRMTHPVTGGQKGQKLARFSLIPSGPLREVANVFGYGAIKYSPNNWRLGYEWSLSLDALERHINAFTGGEDIDPESGRLHLACAIFHCLVLMEWGTTHPELDDRIKTTESPNVHVEWEPKAEPAQVATPHGLYDPGSCRHRTEGLLVCGHFRPCPDHDPIPLKKEDEQYGHAV